MIEIKIIICPEDKRKSHLSFPNWMSKGDVQKHLKDALDAIDIDISEKGE